MKKLIFILSLLVLMLISGNISAQYQKLLSKGYSKQETDLFNASVAQFDKADYATAYQGFSQLLSWHAKDPVFCYYCGASLVLLKMEYDKAIKYLKISEENGLNECLYYIGLAYHRKYSFSRAVVYYHKYQEYLISSTKNKSPKIHDMDILIMKAENGRRLVEYSYDLVIVTNRKVSKDNFNYSYELSSLSGSLVVKPDFFKMKYDKLITHTDLVYISKYKDVCYFSSYGDTKAHGLDIYVSYNGEEGWSTPQKVKGKINTDFDEAYPFLSADETTLYFASTGHNSIGGYDIFKSVYDEATGEWGEPENLNFPINTPFNDFMYATDKNDVSAFFASDRESKNDQVNVYRFLIDENPVKVKMFSEKEVVLKATMPMTAGADKELKDRQKAKEESDAQENTDTVQIIAQNDKPATDVELLAYETDSLLTVKKNDLKDFSSYSKKLDVYSMQTLDKIKEMREQTASLENKTDVKSVQTRDSLTREIANLANQTIVFYDLSRSYKNVVSTTESFVDYLIKEYTSATAQKQDSAYYTDRIKEIHKDAQEVNVFSPRQKLIEEKLDEKDQLTENKDKILVNIDVRNKEIRDIEQLQSAKMNLLREETDSVERERYIKELNKLDSQKGVVLNNIKTLEIQERIVNIAISKIDALLSVLDNMDELIANVNISKYSEEDFKEQVNISELRKIVSTQTEKEEKIVENTVAQEEKFVVEKVDYEAIPIAENKAKKIADENLLAYKSIVSDKVASAIDVAVSIDNLNADIKNKEQEFDNTDSDDEKNKIISEINSIQQQIDKKNSVLDIMNSPSNSANVQEAISEFRNLKTETYSNENWSKYVSSTQDLISKSGNLNQRLSTISNRADDKAEYDVVNIVKSDVDSQIVANVEAMREIALQEQKTSDILAKINSNVADIKASEGVSAKSKKLLADETNAVEKLSSTASENYEEVGSAEAKLLDAVNDNISLLTKEYSENHKIYQVYSQNISENSELSSKAQKAKSRAEEYYYQATAAEDAYDMMKKMSNASQEIKQANAYYEQILSENLKADIKQKTKVEDLYTERLLDVHNNIETIKQQKQLAIQNEELASKENQQSQVLDVKASVAKQQSLQAKVDENVKTISELELAIETSSKSEQKKLSEQLTTANNTNADDVADLTSEKASFYGKLNNEIPQSSKTSAYNSQYQTYLSELQKVEKTATADQITATEKSEYKLVETMLPLTSGTTREALQSIYEDLDAKYSTIDFQASVAKQQSLQAKVDENVKTISELELAIETSSKSEQKKLSEQLTTANNTNVDDVADLTSEKASFYGKLNNEIPQSSKTSAYNSQYQTYLSELQKVEKTATADQITATEKSEYKLVETMLPLTSGTTREALQSIYEDLDAKYSTIDFQASVAKQQSLQSKVDENVKTISELELAIETSSKSEQKKLSEQLTTANNTNADDVADLTSEKASFYGKLNNEIPQSSKTSAYNSQYQTYLNELQKVEKTATADQITATEKSEYKLVETMLPLTSGTTREALQSIYEDLDAKYSDKQIAQSQSQTLDLRTSVAKQQSLQAKVDENVKTISELELAIETSSKSEQKKLSEQLTTANNTNADDVADLTSEKASFYGKLNNEIPQSSKTSAYNSQYQTYLNELQKVEKTATADQIAATEKSEYKLVETMLPLTSGTTREALQSIYEDLDAKYSTIDFQASVAKQQSLQAKVDENVKTISELELAIETSSKSEQKKLSEQLTTANNTNVDDVADLTSEKASFYGKLNNEIPQSSKTSAYNSQYQTYLNELQKVEKTATADQITATEKSEYKLVETMLPLTSGTTREALQSIYEDLDAKYSTIDFQASVAKQQSLQSKVDENVKTISELELAIETSSKSEQKKLSEQLTTANNTNADDVADLTSEKASFYGKLNNEIPQSSKTSAYNSQYQTYLNELQKVEKTATADQIAATEKSEYKLVETMLPLTSGTTREALQSIYEDLDAKYSDKQIAQSQSQTLDLRTSVAKQQSLQAKVDENVKTISELELAIETSSKSEQKKLSEQLTTANNTNADDVADLTSEKASFYGKLNNEIPQSSKTSAYNSQYQTYLNELQKVEKTATADQITATEKSEYKLVETMLPLTSGTTREALQSIYEDLDAKYSTIDFQASVAKQQSLQAKVDENVKTISELELAIETSSKSEQKKLSEQLTTANNTNADDVADLTSEKASFYGNLNNEIPQSSKTSAYNSQYQTYLNELQKVEKTAAADQIAATEKSEYKLVETMLPLTSGTTREALQSIYEDLDAKYSENIAQAGSVDPQMQSSISRQNILYDRVQVETDSVNYYREQAESAKRARERDEYLSLMNQNLDAKYADWQVLSREKLDFYDKLDKKLSMSLMTVPENIRNEYRKLYSSYIDKLGNIRVGLQFFDEKEADKIISQTEQTEYMLLQEILIFAPADMRDMISDLKQQIEIKYPSIKVKLLASKESENNNDESENVSKASQTDLADNNQPDKSAENTSAKTMKSAQSYSEDSYGIYPFPENEGLCYRIQIGAFYDNYKIHDFNGLSLIFKENVPNTRLVRYLTGEYEKYTSAVSDLSTVRNVGYRDAFIVAYYNGKRISISEARKLEPREAVEKNDIHVVVNKVLAQNPMPEHTNIPEQQQQAVSVAEQVAQNQTATGLSEEVLPVSANNLTSEMPNKDFYFAVQVGIYKTKISSDRLQGLDPINYDVLNSGLVCHTYGVYDDYTEAINSQNRIRRMGIPDAFVVAYINGKKVSYSQGLAYLRKLKAEKQQPIQNINIAENAEPSKKENKVNEQALYYVQVGAFSKAPDGDVVSVFESIAENSNLISVNVRDMNLYWIGSFANRAAASVVLEKAKQYGVIDAFIVTMRGTERISTAEADKITAPEPKSNVEPTTQESANVALSQDKIEYILQLGAFSKTPDAARQSLFKKVAGENSVSVEKSNNLNIYYVGPFSKYVNVEVLQTRAKSLGLTDAFVKAFCNGERIAIKDARAKE